MKDFLEVKRAREERDTNATAARLGKHRDTNADDGEKEK